MNAIWVITIFLLALPFLLKGDSNTPTSFTCTATCPTNKCEGEVEYIHSCNTTALEDRVSQLVKITRANSKSISEMKSVLSKLQNTSYTSGAVLNNLLLLVEELVSIHNETVSSPLPKSCQEIKQRMRASPSGEYLVATSTNHTEYVYCHMETLCGSDDGWTRLAHIDMTDPTESCPYGWRLYEENGVRACGRYNSTGGSCSSVQYQSKGMRYTEICGKAIGYQFGTTNALDLLFPRDDGANNINSYYVDGLSLTRGNPRKHVWTYMAGLKEDNSHYVGTSTCPCQTGSQQTNQIPTFIGNDYYCESGNPVNTSAPIYEFVLYTADRLWDGEQCNGLEAPCCNSTTLPWFHKVLDSPTNDYIEARVCGDQNATNEDTAIEQLEVFVK